jgi:AcrR family transcriptional regulator
MSSSTSGLDVSRAERRTWTERRPEVLATMLKAVEQILGGGVTYTQMSVGILVKAAGISRTTFYLYFQDKSDLLLALTDEVIAALEESAQGWWEFPPEGTKADLRDALRPEYDVYRQHWAVMAAVVEAAAYDGHVRDRFDELVRVSTARMADRIRAGQHEGTVRASLDTELTATWIGALIERGLYQLVVGAEPSQLERLLTAETEIIWNVLYRDAR